MIGDIFVVPFFARCIFAPEYAISDVFLLGWYGGFLIQFIKLILELPISILLIIAPTRN